MMQGEFPELVPALPEMFLAVAAMGLLLFGAFQRDDPLGTYPTARMSRLLAMIALGLTAMLVLAFAARSPVTTFGGMFVVDDFASFFKTLILIAAALSLLIAEDFLEAHGVARFEYSVLILLATVGMMMMISANDLISLYLGLELQSLALYVVAAFQRDDVRSSEAGLKYFILGALASGMLLYGSSLIYGFTGTTDFAQIAAVLGRFAETPPPVGLIVGLVFILAGLAFKVSAVPFHMWTPDVYEGAPTPVTAFFSVAPKLAALALLVRVLADPFGGVFAQWQQIVIFMSICSMVLGAFAAVGQRNIKRLMAYSSIGHVGYALIGVAAGDAAGVRGVMIYMAIYMVMNLGVFACILCMQRRNRMVEEIADLAGLGRSHPGVALAMTIFMFSMAGIPPLAGFFGKLYIFLAAVDAKLYGLAIVGVLSSVVAAYYYLRIVKTMYFDELVEPLDTPISREIAVVIIVCGVLVGLFFIYPGPLLSVAGGAAVVLVGG